MYKDIRTKDGYLHIGSDGIRFLSFEDLNRVKYAWRESPEWHPVDSLFLILDRIEWTPETEEEKKFRKMLSALTEKEMVAILEKSFDKEEDDELTGKVLGALIRKNVTAAISFMRSTI